jgi:acetyltransferase-like isoleucine patch superfamily enzyme
VNPLHTIFAAGKLACLFAYRATRRWVLLVRIYRRFGIVLPQGATICDPESIKIGRNFGISASCELYCQDPEHGSELRIGNDVKLHSGVLIIADCGGKITIGNDVLIAPYVIIRAANHQFDNPSQLIRLQGHKADHIVIGDDVWLGSGVVILPGALIGNGSVIGAGSVVTGEIPPLSIAVGAPARVIGRRGSTG